MLGSAPRNARFYEAASLLTNASGNVLDHTFQGALLETIKHVMQLVMGSASYLPRFTLRRVHGRCAKIMTFVWELFCRMIHSMQQSTGGIFQRTFPFVVEMRGFRLHNDSLYSFDAFHSQLFYVILCVSLFFFILACSVFRLSGGLCRKSMVWLDCSFHSRARKFGRASHDDGWIGMDDVSRWIHLLKTMPRRKASFGLLLPMHSFLLSSTCVRLSPPWFRSVFPLLVEEQRPLIKRKNEVFLFPWGCVCVIDPVVVVVVVCVWEWWKGCPPNKREGVACTSAGVGKNEPWERSTRRGAVVTKYRHNRLRRCCQQHHMMMMATMRTTRSKGRMSPATWMDKNQTKPTWMNGRCKNTSDQCKPQRHVTRADVEPREPYTTLGDDPESIEVRTRLPRSTLEDNERTP